MTSKKKPAAPAGNRPATPVVRQSFQTRPGGRTELPAPPVAKTQSSEPVEDEQTESEV